MLHMRRLDTIVSSLLIILKDNFKFTLGSYLYFLKIQLIILLYEVLK